jgi:hypothetical protein
MNVMTTYNFLLVLSMSVESEEVKNVIVEIKNGVPWRNISVCTFRNLLA